MFNTKERVNYVKNKVKIHEYKQSVRQAEIEVQNQKLLRKLVEISTGKKTVHQRRHDGIPKLVKMQSKTMIEGEH